MKRLPLILSIFLCQASTLLAQSQDAPRPTNFLQFGLDMSLQHPYDHSLKDVFPNGKTFGLDAAFGRWFTPELGLRLRVNWENGIPLFENHHANWLAPMNQPGVNMDKGGYLTFVGDVPFNLHNLIGGYQPCRLWNLSVFPRAGVAYNFGVSKGSPLLGLGIHNSFRLNDRFSLYLDGAYQFVSSGFTPVGTGTGTAANAFMDISLGAQYNLNPSSTISPQPSTIPPLSLREGWFLQTAWDMTLHKPYRQHFSEVLPKGRTMGFNGAVGKRFSPEISLRARLNWENGFPLFKNKNLEWIPGQRNPDGTITPNMDKGGYLTAGLDVMLNVPNLLGFYRPDRRWNLYGFARAGIGSNLAIHSASPMVGAGLEATYRLRSRVSLFTDLCYQAITSEFYDYVSCTGMSVSTGHNGFFDLSLGVQIDLGKM